METLIGFETTTRRRRDDDVDGRVDEKLAVARAQNQFGKNKDGAAPATTTTWVPERMIYKRERERETTGDAIWLTLFIRRWKREREREREREIEREVIVGVRPIAREKVSPPSGVWDEFRDEVAALRSWEKNRCIWNWRLWGSYGFMIFNGCFCGFLYLFFSLRFIT